MSIVLTQSCVTARFQLSRVTRGERSAVMSKDGSRVWAVEVGGVAYSVRATVIRDSGEHTTWISSVTRDGREISDGEFEPIAGQLEGAVIDKHCELAGAAQEGRLSA